MTCQHIHRSSLEGFTPDEVEVIQRAIERAKDEVRDEMVAGRIPTTVTDFATLHDYIDANELGGLTDGFLGRFGPEPEDGGINDHAVDAANAVEDAVCEWLATRRNPRTDPRCERCGSYDRSDGHCSNADCPRWLPPAGEVLT